MKKHAFTLAEVLVTLGIIGVVAAITLPTLIKEYQKHVWVNQLKTTYSILEQGFQKMLVDDEVENLSDTTAFQSMKQDYCSGYSANCADFIDNLKNYIPIVSITKVNNYRYNYLNNRGFGEYSGNIIYLKNGAFYLTHPIRCSINKPTLVNIPVNKLKMQVDLCVIDKVLSISMSMVIEAPINLVVMFTCFT